MQRKRYLTPLTWPAISFAAMILLGTLALCLPVCQGEGTGLSVVDAAFLSTSAVCVTGLSPVDISRALSPVGQGVLLVLIQVGGLGVMTYTSLIFLLWRKQVPFTSREAVSQALLGGDFNMGQFLLQVVCIVLGVELLAALVLFWHDPEFFSPFSALFHAVSAFCNAGFALAPDNMMAFREDGLVCTVICLCIVLGGIGFGVLRECLGILSRGRLAPVTRLSRLSRLVINTSLFLIVAGALLIFMVEWRRAGNEDLVGDGLHLFLVSLFHSVSARTAGFNMVDMAHWSHASLLVHRRRAGLVRRRHQDRDFPPAGGLCGRPGARGSPDRLPQAGRAARKPDAGPDALFAVHAEHLFFRLFADHHGKRHPAPA